VFLYIGYTFFIETIDTVFVLQVFAVQRYQRSSVADQKDVRACYSDNMSIYVDVDSDYLSAHINYVTPINAKFYTVFQKLLFSSGN